jgi:hypothetical protein
MKKCILTIGIAVLLASASNQAEAGWVRVGIGIGFPVYAGPYYGPYCYPYYQPYPVYVAPAPAPVYVAPAPAVIQSNPPAYQQAQPNRSNYDETAPPPRSIDAHQADISRYLQQLSQQDDHVRGDAAMELGRLKAQQAIDPLCNTLNSDRSPQVRETAARALGLIGSTRALNALQSAALADSDRDVRHSAQYAAEVIRASLRRD